MEIEKSENEQEQKIAKEPKGLRKFFKYLKDNYFLDLIEIFGLACTIIAFIGSIQEKNETIEQYRDYMSKLESVAVVEENELGEPVVKTSDDFIELLTEHEVKLSNKIKIQEAELETTKLKIEQRKKELDSKDKALQAKETELSRLEGQRSELQEQIDTLIKDKEDYAVQLQATQNEISLIKIEKEAVEKERTILEKENKNLNESLASSREDKSALTRQLLLLNRQVESSEADKEGLNTLISLYHTEISHLSSKVDDLLTDQYSWDSQMVNHLNKNVGVYLVEIDQYLAFIKKNRSDVPKFVSKIDFNQQVYMLLDTVNILDGMKHEIMSASSYLQFDSFNEALAHISQLDEYRGYIVN